MNSDQSTFLHPSPGQDAAHWFRAWHPGAAGFADPHSGIRAIVLPPAHPLGGAFGNPRAQVLRKLCLARLLRGQLERSQLDDGLGYSLREQDLLDWHGCANERISFLRCRRFTTRC